MPATSATPVGQSAAILTTDILVLGAGLAGLRSAWAAAESAPNLSVTVVRPGNGPDGSSFANRNNALGIQLPDTDARRTAFFSEAMALAAPGLIDPALVTILAEEGEARVRELMALGLCLRQAATGGPARFPGCGSHDPRALVFDNLGDAFNRFFAKTRCCGVNFINGIEIMGILDDGGTARGAWGLESATNRPVALGARAVVMTLGGPAPLFARHQAGPGNSGLALGILAETGVRTANEPYIQFMWGREDASFLNPAQVLAPGNRIRPPDPDASRTDTPPLDPLRLDASAPSRTLDGLRSARALHCPAFHHRPQAVLDRLLLLGLHQDGFARVITPAETIKAGMYAHAGNGGAVVDEHGATTLPGLFAAGECATGMHGANRLGGAMVLATQVFGRRAGLAAACHAADAETMDMGRLYNLGQEEFRHIRNSGDECRALRSIADGLARHALFGGTPGDSDGLAAFRTRLAELARSSETRIRIAARTALLVSRPTDDPFQPVF
ncbi:FAD-binding protein [Pseudodesulfovibrio sp. F-1]|uniref:FAD-binding protein n=1 Tax=Pseudodesulfovibrio alkaliphilus TaxID=2661613 RepID=A0A7K1KJZ9_9BACT|nr:FAD-binding protein [Pseudodesulfovibrio alkaliphilus]MUM76212.1 FAD-binding protein [Pseudodesulfovibrio alkaliphilus]